MTRDQEIAWAAGLFEGEGCFTGSRGKSDIHVALVMSDEDVVRRFAQVIGLGAVYRQPRKNSPSYYKPMWRWQADGVNAEFVAQLLLPYLGGRRRARATALLNRRDGWRATVRRARTCPVCSAHFCPVVAGAAAANQIYCSRLCRQRASDAGYRERGRKARIEDGSYIPAHGAKTHCVNGHEFTPANTRIDRGARSCRACGRERALRRYHLNRERICALRRARRAARVASLG